MDLKIINLRWEKGVDVRIVPITEESSINDINNQLTQLDSNGVQCGVHIAGDPITIDCAGSLNATPVMDITCPVRLTLGEDGIPRVYVTIEELIEALEAHGLTVEQIPDEM